MRKIVMLQLIT